MTCPSLLGFQGPHAEKHIDLVEAIETSAENPKPRRMLFGKNWAIIEWSCSCVELGRGHTWERRASVEDALRSVGEDPLVWR
jgi:hypothetical protein